MLRNEDIINRPASSLLEEFSFATASLRGDFEDFPLLDYLLESLLLKLTGFQEQKLKAITWEMGSNDLEFRRKLLNDLKLGEYSSLESKKTVFSELIKLFSKSGDSSIIDTVIDNNFKKEIMEKVHSEMDSCFKNAGISLLASREYRLYNENRKIKFNTNQFLCKKDNKPPVLLEGGLTEIYDDLYSRRNSIAHNVRSAKPKTPTLEDLSKTVKNPKNYFDYFTLILLIDKIFCEVYFKFINNLENNPWRY